MSTPVPPTAHSRHNRVDSGQRENVARRNSGVYPDDGCHLRTVLTACHNMQDCAHPQPSTTSLFIACMCDACIAARGIMQHARFMMRVAYCAASALHAAQHAHNMMHTACCAACALYRALGCRCAMPCLRLRGWSYEPVVLGANGLPGAQHRLVDMAFCMCRGY